MRNDGPIIRDIWQQIKCTCLYRCCDSHKYLKYDFSSFEFPSCDGAIPYARNRMNSNALRRQTNLVQNLFFHCILESALYNTESCNIFGLKLVHLFRIKHWCNFIKNLFSVALKKCCNFPTLYTLNKRNTNFWNTNYNYVGQHIFKLI